MTEPAPRTAFVAGGGGALGRAVVAALLAEDYRVCVPWFVEEEEAGLRAAHPAEVDADRLRLSRCDVTDPDQVAALLDVAAADWGPLWLATSTVGGWAGGERVDELADLTVFDRMYRLNLKTAAVVAHEGLRHMGEQGGRVVLVGARQALRPSAGEAAYSAAKAGVTALVGALAAELSGSDRTANAVLPALIDTPGNRAAMPHANHADWTPPEAIADVITWLAGPQAWLVSGATIPVYGRMG